MLPRSDRLASVLLLISAIASTISALSSIANTTSVLPGSTDLTPASSVLPAASTAAPLPKSTSFYLVVADKGTPFDGNYLYVGQAFSGDGQYVLLFGQGLDLGGGSVFHLSEGSYGSLVSNPAGYVGTYYDLYGAILFQDPDPAVLEEYGETPVTCELADGAILCQNTEYSGFYTYASTVVDGGSTVPYVELGPLPFPSGSVNLTLLPIPVE